jgi:hypothetical protein
MGMKGHGLTRFKTDEYSRACIPDVELFGHEILFRKFCLLEKMDRVHKNHLYLRITSLRLEDRFTLNLIAL